MRDVDGEVGLERLIKLAVELDSKESAVKVETGLAIGGNADLCISVVIDTATWLFVC